MLGEPLTHFLISPRPIKRMGIEPVVLRPGSGHMLDELLPAIPGTSPQVAIAEGIDQQFRLVEPRGMDRRKAGAPPATAFGPVPVGIASGMTRVAILDQEHPFPVAMASPKLFQLPDVMLCIFMVQDGHLHAAGMDNQEQQQVDRPMADVFELPLLDRPWNSSSDRSAFQNLEIRDLIYRHRPEALPCQPGSVSIAPEYSFGSLLELGIQAGGLPIPRTMRLQIYLLQNPTHHAGADGGEDSISHCLAGQIAAGPVGNVQALGDGFQAGQLDDLSPLEGGKSAGDGLSGAYPPT
jgi:hypothetical protein